MTDHSKTLAQCWQQKEQINIVVIGASGGIGSAMSKFIEQHFNHVNVIRVGRSVSNNSELSIDYLDEQHIESCANDIISKMPNIDAVINCAGILHTETIVPEKTLQSLTQEKLSQLMAINAYGPILLAKHLQRCFKHTGMSLFASLSARVGSISDNRLGGWYSYRASKAAHNMLLKNLSIEWGRVLPNTVVVALQPGTVDTLLSKPYSKSSATVFSPEQTAENLWQVLLGLRLENSGQFFDWKNEVIDY